MSEIWSVLQFIWAWGLFPAFWVRWRIVRRRPLPLLEKFFDAEFWAFLWPLVVLVVIVRKVRKEE